MSDADDRGHLFVIKGDLTTLDCGAVLVPTDRTVTIEDPWPLLTHGHLVPERWRWPDGGRVGMLAELEDGPDVWLADVSGDERAQHPEWYVEPVLEFVRLAAAQLRGSVRTRRVANGLPPRLAVPMVGTRFGGSRADQGPLFSMLVERLHEACLEHACDIVLVTHSPKAFAAAQRARLRLQPDTGADWWPSLDEGLRARAHDLATRNWHGSLVLFIGAGASMSAGLPSWQGLLDALCEAANAQADSDSAVRGRRRLDPDRLRRLDLRDQAALIRRAFPDDDAYRSALQGALATARYSLVHGLLASLDVHEAITTNYDNLYEQACRTPGRELAILPYEVAKPHTDWLLKLHGSVDHPDSMVVTRDDYLGLPERAGALYGILQAMLLTEHLLFVGYSLSDEPFHRVMHEVRRAIPDDVYQRLAEGPDKAGAVVLLEDDDLLSDLWSHELDVVSMGPSVDVDDVFVDDRDGEVARRLAARARRLEIFLDLLAHESADVAHFILDPDYRNMLDTDEQELADHLLAAGLVARRMDTAVARRIRELMSASLGWDGADARDPA